MIPDHRKYTSGVKDPKLDTFVDVERALSKWLYLHDKSYREYSDAQKNRNPNRKVSACEEEE